MNISRVLCLILWPGIACVVSCSEHDPVICVPGNLKTITDSVAFEYDTSGKLQTIYYYYFGLHQKDELRYNDAGQLTRIRRKSVSGTDEEVEETGELIYASDGKPESLNSWGSNTNLPPQVTNFLHDANGRLIEKEIVVSGGNILYRYEYDDHDNVSQIFYTNQSGIEVLGRENISFDNHSRFYVQPLDFEILNKYVFGAEPSKNNNLASTVYWDGPLLKLTDPLSVTYNLSYNASGLIIHSIRISETGQPIQEFSFHGLNYECR